MEFHLLTSLYIAVVTSTVFSQNIEDVTTVPTPQTSPTSAPLPSYEQLLHMSNYLESKLSSVASRLKGRSRNHVPPGGSKVLQDKKTGKPYIETSVQTVVSVSRIDFMDVDSQTLTFAAEVGLAWMDTHLAWNYTEIPIVNIVMDPLEIWTPYILPLDLMGYDYIPSTLMPSVTVFYNGAVISKVTVTIKAPCDVEVLTYPFDTHHCHLKLTQVFNPGARINFIAVPVSDKSTSNLLFNSQHRHREWDMVYMNSTSDSDGTYSLYHLEIALRRKAVFYAIVLIMPCIVLNFLSLLMFVVDVEGTSRVDLALNLILSFFVLLIILVDSLPPSGGEVPLLGTYVTVSTLVVVFMMLGSLVMIGLHRKKVKGKPLPAFYKCLSKKIKLFGCLNGDEKTYDLDENKNKETKERVPLAMMEKSTENSREDVNSLNEEMKFDAVIFNINIILFVITILIHIGLLIGVVVVWIQKSE